MAQVVNLRPPLPLTIQTQSSLKLPNGFLCSSFRSAENPNWRSLQLKLKCKARVSALFSNNGREEQARKALEGALGGKKSEFEKWNKEIQKREEMGGGGDSGGGGWFGWKRWFSGDHFWEEAQQTSLVVLVLIFVYLLIAKGETLLAVVFNPLLFGLRGVRSAFAFVTKNIMKRLPAGMYSIPTGNTATEEVASRLSAKESVIRKWASD